MLNLDTALHLTLPANLVQTTSLSLTILVYRQHVAVCAAGGQPRFEDRWVSNNLLLASIRSGFSSLLQLVRTGSSEQLVIQISLKPNY